MLLSDINNTHTSVTMLNLSENYITSLEDCVEKIKENASLEKLNLANNRLTSETLKSFIAALKTHPTLKELDLRNNQLDDEIVESLLEMLKENKTLKKVLLSGNAISEQSDLEATPSLALRSTVCRYSSMSA